MKMKNAAIAGGVVGMASILFWLLCLNHVAINEVGVCYDSINGRVTMQTNCGWYLTHPMERVSTVSTTPFIVEFPGDKFYAKTLTQKLVRIRPEGIHDLVALEGFHNLLGSGMERYAFSGREYPFLEVIEGK